MNRGLGIYSSPAIGRAHLRIPSLEGHIVQAAHAAALCPSGAVGLLEQGLRFGELPMAGKPRLTIGKVIALIRAVTGALQAVAAVLKALHQS